MDNKIDFVVTWVDGEDPAWQADKARYSSVSSDNRRARWRDWDQLRYWFRAVENYAPWVNKIHFVTYGHLPEWLDTGNPKLNIVNHRDFIPSQYLPVFNSTAVEVHLHRIPKLAERFVYFCDDCYLMKPCKPTDFFKRGKPVDMVKLEPVQVHNNEMYYYHLYNNYSIYRQYFRKKQLISFLHKYINIKYGKAAMSNAINLLAKNLYFCSRHLPMPLLKSTMELMWSKHSEELERTAKSRFRRNTDNQLGMFRGYQLITGNFHPANIKGIVLGTSDTDRTCEVISNCKYKFICLNDNSSDSDYEKHKKQINEAFDIIFPKGCRFEK